MTTVEAKNPAQSQYTHEPPQVTAERQYTSHMVTALAQPSHSHSTASSLTDELAASDGEVGVEDVDWAEVIPLGSTKRAWEGEYQA